jgi:hypothetical protein
MHPFWMHRSWWKCCDWQYKMSTRVVLVPHVACLVTSSIIIGPKTKQIKTKQNKHLWRVRDFSRRKCSLPEHGHPHSRILQASCGSTFSQANYLLPQTRWCVNPITKKEHSLRSQQIVTWKYTPEVTRTRTSYCYCKSLLVIWLMVLEQEVRSLWPMYTCITEFIHKRIPIGALMSIDGGDKHKQASSTWVSLSHGSPRKHSFRSWYQSNLEVWPGS